MPIRHIRWVSTMAAVAGFALLGAPRDAHAVLQLFATVGAVNFQAIDNVLNDVDPVLGQLALAPTNVGGLNVQGSFHTSSRASGNNFLTSGSSSVTNTTGAPVMADVVVGDNNFIGPAFTVTTTGSGTWTNAAGSTILLRYFDDPANAQPADSAGDAPGNLVDSFSDTAVGPLDSFSHNAGPLPLAIPDLANFSMTLRFTFTLVGGGQLVSRGQSMLKPVGVIPEPGTMVMAIAGLPLVGLAAWRRRRKA